MTSTMPGAADAGDAGSAVASAKPGLVRPELRADDPEPRLERLPVDPHPLDRARRGPLAAADLGALEGRARSGLEAASRKSRLPRTISAFVPTSTTSSTTSLSVGRLGEDDPGRVGPDVAGDARQDVDAGAGMRPELQLRGADADGPIRRQGERRGAERDRVDPEQEVMHDRVADDRELEDLVALDARAHRQLGDEAVQRLADRGGHLAGALGMHHRVGDPAHQVLAEPDLRVHHAVAREDGAVREVGEVAGDRRRADVDRDAVRLVVEARPDPRHGPAVVDRDGDRERCPSRAPAGGRG